MEIHFNHSDSIQRDYKFMSCLSIELLCDLVFGVTIGIKLRLQCSFIIVVSAWLFIFINIVMAFGIARKVLLKKDNQS